jgi:A/G-specific adenine glycosylase
LLAGLWEFPGGKVEEGETLPQALQREIQEELCIQIKIGEKLNVFRHAYTHFRVTVHAFYCSMMAGKLRAVETQDIAWATPQELFHFPMGKVDRLIARMISTDMVKSV